MIFWNSMLVWLMLSCQTASTDLGRAVMLEQQGDTVRAFDLYAKVMIEHPSTQEAKSALRRVQRLHLKTAKEMERSNSERAKKLYQSMVEKWPDSDYAVFAHQKIAQLSSGVKIERISNVAIEPTAEKEIPETVEDTPEIILEAEELTVPRTTNSIVDEAEKSACQTARDSESRIVWQQYKQDFPDGICIADAEEFLAVVAPRILEIESAKEKALVAQKALRKLCVEYRLSNTTSNPKACDNPSSALIAEFARLQRRKVDLLKGDDSEKIAYYKKFVPPRWDKLSEVETTACADLMEYVENLVRDGVDQEAVRSELSFVETCFSVQGGIE